jgi:phosphoglycolate phosphatase
MKLTKPIKHVIWDWNGTLFDDVELCLDIINSVLTKRNLKTLTLEKYREIFTFPVQDYYEKAGLDFSKYSFEILGREWMDEYEARKNTCGLHLGAEEALKQISQKGIGQSILSAYSQNTLEEIVKNFGIDNYFLHMVGLDHIYATSKIENGKELMKRLGNGKGETLFIGDTVHDFEVANEIGAECILISGGHQEKQKLEECGVMVYESLTNIPFDELFR